MMMNVHFFLTGATFGLDLVAMLLFVRFFRRTSDRLFLFFAAAFLLMGVDRAAMLFSIPEEESRTTFYVVRLVSYLLIIWAIVDKNRRRYGA